MRWQILFGIVAIALGVCAAIYGIDGYLECRGAGGVYARPFMSFHYECFK